MPAQSELNIFVVARGIRLSARSLRAQAGENGQGSLQVGFSSHQL